MFDEALGVHPQSERFTSHARWDFESTGPDKYPLLLHFPYFDLYRKQVVKQADLVMALLVCGDSFSLEEKQRDFEYYEPLTVRDSSLSACVQAVIAAEVGHLDLAYDYFGRGGAHGPRRPRAQHRRRDPHRRAGGHLDAAVAGFGGMRDHGGRLTFSPRLPGGLTRLRFRLRFAGALLLVDVTHEAASYSVLKGDSLEIEHHGESVTVDASGVTREIPPLSVRDAPRQPPGREPARRRKPG